MKMIIEKNTHWTDTAEKMSLCLYVLDKAPTNLKVFYLELILWQEKICERNFFFVWTRTFLLYNFCIIKLAVFAEKDLSTAWIRNSTSFAKKYKET